MQCLCFQVLKESYKLELASLQEELKCAQMENMLKTKSEGGNSFMTRSDHCAKTRPDFAGRYRSF